MIRRRLILALCLIGLLAGPAMTSGDPAAQEPAPSAAIKLAQQNMHDLWRAYVQAPQEPPAPLSLRQAAQEALSIPAPAKTASGPSPAASAATTEPAKTASAPATDEASAFAASAERAGPSMPRAASAPSEPTTQASDALKGLSAKNVGDPVALADALFQSRHFQEAAAFYEQAFNDAKDDEAKSWLLFQMGNCRREFNPASAHGTYKRLLSDYPKSAWVPAAKAADELLEWYQVNKPRELLESRQPKKTN